MRSRVKPNSTMNGGSIRRKLTTSLSALFIAVAFCFTASVYTDTDFTRTQQAVSLIAVWMSLSLPMIIARAPIAMRLRQGRQAYFVRAYQVVMLVAILTIVPLVRITNFVDAEDQVETVLYSIAVFATAWFMIAHVWRCGTRVLFFGCWIAAIIGPIGYVLAAALKGQLGEIVSIDRRFSVEGMHPNLLGFCCAGFASVLICSAVLMRTRLRWLSAAAAVINLTIIYLASSRGSLIAILLACFTVAGIHGLRMLKYAAIGKPGALKKLLAILVVTYFVVLCGTFGGPMLMKSQLGQDVVERLEIFSQYRGIDTGLTGRLETWQWVYNDYNAIDFWLGLGPRKSVIVAGNIDNGYIVVLLENGLLAGGCIIFRMFYVTIVYMWIALRTKDKCEYKASLSLAFVSVVFLMNNVVARYLFGIGNPFCLIGLGIFSLGVVLLNEWVAEQRLASSKDEEMYNTVPTSN
jgi:hypothetical protein